MMLGDTRRHLRPGDGSSDSCPMLVNVMTTVGYPPDDLLFKISSL